MAGSSEPAFLFLRAKKELMLQQPFSYFCNSPAPRAVACDNLHPRASAHLWHVKNVMEPRLKKGSPVSMTFFVFLISRILSTSQRAVSRNDSYQIPSPSRRSALFRPHPPAFHGRDPVSGPHPYTFSSRRRSFRG